MRDILWLYEKDMYEERGINYLIVEERERERRKMIKYVMLWI